MEIVSTLSLLSEALKLAREAANSAKEGASIAKDIQHEKIFAAAEKLRQSVECVEAELGKAYGYQLCKCTLPPQACLKIAYDEKTFNEISKCPKCGQIYPVHLAEKYENDRSIK
jgi:hypothetical protein